MMGMQFCILIAILPLLASAAKDKCGTKVSCDWKLTKVAKNKLHKGGELRYKDVCSALGKSYDLVVTSEDYTTKKPKRNGLSGSYGNINMNAGAESKFKFTFYETGTTTPVTMDSFYFTVYDIDGEGPRKGPLKVTESVTVSGYDSFSVDSNCELNRQISPESATFTATTFGNHADNPTNPNKLTAKQTSRAVTFLFTSKSSFTANFAMIGSGGNRNVIFAGQSSISKKCSVPVCRPAGNCKLSFKSVTQNNLGGAGPDTGAEELRYGKVCEVSGDTLDLVVTATSPYTPSKASVNGASGAYGIVNLKSKTKTDFKFAFVKSGTNTPSTLDATTFTIFDIDSGNPATTAKEVFTATGYDAYTLGNNSELSVDASAKSLVLKSTTFGDAADNPTDPMKLTPLQLSRSVSLSYSKVKSFPVSFEITGGQTGRNFVFGGESSLNQMCSSSDTLQEPGLIDDFEMPELEQGSSNAMQLMFFACASFTTCFLVGVAARRFSSKGKGEVTDEENGGCE